MRWTPEQDEALREVMKNYPRPKHSYSVIANELSKVLNFEVTGPSVRNRYIYGHLSYDKGPLLEWEKKIILEFVAENGHQWARLSHEIIPHRSDNWIKNVYYSVSRKKNYNAATTQNEQVLFSQFLI